jgi:DNA-binding NarL/FixJ family response regulator
MTLNKILHVEDHQMVTLGLEQVVKSLVPDVEFRSVTNTADAFKTLKTWQPDLIFLDLQLESETAMEHIAAIKKAAGGAPIAIYSAIDDVFTMRLTIKRGAAAYIRKGLPLDEQREAIEKLLANGYYFPPELAKADTKALPSDRKLAVLQLLVAGKPNKVIARELNVSPDTVKTHVQQLFQMLGVKNRTQAADVAKKRGLV